MTNNIRKTALRIDHLSDLIKIAILLLGFRYILMTFQSGFLFLLLHHYSFSMPFLTMI